MCIAQLKQLAALIDGLQVWFLLERKISFDSDTISEKQKDCGTATNSKVKKVKTELQTLSLYRNIVCV